MITVLCPSCGKQLNAPDDRAGKRAKCPKCGESIEIPTRAAADVDPPLPPLPKVESFDVDEMLGDASARAALVAGPSAVEDKTAAEQLRLLVHETRESRSATIKELQGIKQQTKRTAFWCMVLGLPLLIGFLLFALAFFMGFGGAISDAIRR